MTEEHAKAMLSKEDPEWVKKHNARVVANPQAPGGYCIKMDSCDPEFDAAVRTLIDDLKGQPN